MNTAILILYIVTHGHMQILKLPFTSPAACEEQRETLSTQFHAVHGECKTLKAKP